MADAENLSLWRIKQRVLIVQTDIVRDTPILLDTLLPFIFDKLLLAARPGSNWYLNIAGIPLPAFFFCAITFHMKHWQILRTTATWRRGHTPSWNTLHGIELRTELSSNKCHDVFDLIRWWRWFGNNWLRVKPLNNRINPHLQLNRNKRIIMRNEECRQKQKLNEGH